MDVLMIWILIIILRESIPRQVVKKSGIPEEGKGVWALKEEIGVWSFQG